MAVGDRLCLYILLFLILNNRKLEVNFVFFFDQEQRAAGTRRARAADFVAGFVIGRRGLPHDATAAPPRELGSGGLGPPYGAMPGGHLSLLGSYISLFWPGRHVVVPLFEEGAATRAAAYGAARRGGAGARRGGRLDRDERGVAEAAPDGIPDLVGAGGRVERQLRRPLWLQGRRPLELPGTEAREGLRLAALVDDDERDRPRGDRPGRDDDFPSSRVTLTWDTDGRAAATATNASAAAVARANLSWRAILRFLIEAPSASPRG